MISNNSFKITDIYGGVYSFESFVSYSDYDFSFAEPFIGDLTLEERYFDQGLPRGCYENENLVWSRSDLVLYQWNGVPIHTNITENDRPFVAATYLLIGLLGIPLNICCGVVLWQNKSLSKSVRFILFIDNSCRIVESIIAFYKAFCVLSWQCVQTEGFISGILINRIMIAITMASVYSMELLLHCLSINRIFAVFFRGRFYSKIQVFTPPYCCLWIIFLSFIYLIDTADLTDPQTGGRCYSGWYLSPLEFYVVGFFSSSFWVFTVVNLLDNVVFGFTLFALALDLITFIGIQVLVKSSAAKKKADMKLSVMMVLTTVIWTTETCFHYYIPWEFNGAYGYYFLYEGAPMLGHCVLSLVILAFNFQKNPSRSLRTASMLSKSLVK